MSNGPWRVDETYLKVKGRWIYLYRGVDSLGHTIDFLLSGKRDAQAAKQFFRQAWAQPHTVNPRTITVDRNAVASGQPDEHWQATRRWMMRKGQVRNLSGNDIRAWQHSSPDYFKSPLER
jgi:transposase-like protein